MPITEDQITHWFSLHPATQEQRDAYRRLCTVGGAFAHAIVDLTPSSADQAAAVRLSRQALMTAIASIACKGK